MSGHQRAAIRHAHEDENASIGEFNPPERKEREDAEDSGLAPGATRARGAGNREYPEEADPTRTCFERDRDRILHSTSFRRLAGKTQVFVFPDDHQRTRLTHALEVAQVAVAIARNLRLNTSLTEAIALGHDCGHGPGGHASEHALSPFLPDGYDHATWGADVALASLNLCGETLDGVRNHSWSHPSPYTPEGIVVSWADRIAYVCHDLEDAVSANVVRYDEIPESVATQCGNTRRSQLSTFIDAMTEGSVHAQEVGMTEPVAQALADLREFNYHRIYLRPESQSQGDIVIRVLRQLVEYYHAHPEAITDTGPLSPSSDGALFEAVRYVGGMTDRFAFRQAVALLGFRYEDLPTSI